MPRQHRPAEDDSARSGKRPKRKRARNDYLVVTAVVAAGVLLAYFTRNQRGHVATILGCASVLAAICYWHRRNPAAIRLLVGVVPVVLVLGMALALTPATRPAARGFTVGASSYSETMTAGAVTGSRDVVEMVLAKLAKLAAGMVKP